MLFCIQTILYIVVQVRPNSSSYFSTSLLFFNSNISICCEARYSFFDKSPEFQNLPFKSPLRINNTVTHSRARCYLVKFSYPFGKSAIERDSPIKNSSKPNPSRNIVGLPYILLNYEYIENKVESSAT